MLVPSVPRACEPHFAERACIAIAGVFVSHAWHEVMMELSENGSRGNKKDSSKNWRGAQLFRPFLIPSPPSRQDIFCLRRFLHLVNECHTLETDSRNGKYGTAIRP